MASAKSWLAHAAVDRTAAILPWGAGGEGAAGEGGPLTPKISPCDASAALPRARPPGLGRGAPDAPLAEQDVVLTVPASFDEAARELTVLAAQRGGLSVRASSRSRQAAFYDYACARGTRRSLRLLDEGEPSALVLVCDVGGGTTDLSLLRVARGRARRARPS